MSNNLLLNIQQDTEEVMELLKDEISKKLIEQGHSRGQSNIVENLEYKIKQVADGIVSEMYINDYYKYLEKGVHSSRIPYKRSSKRSNSGIKSAYIKGLINHWISLNKTPKEAVPLAFATAESHKKEGMPTFASRKFSKDGNRVGFLSNTIEEQEAKMHQLLSNSVTDTISNVFLDIIQIRDTSQPI